VRTIPGPIIPGTHSGEYNIYFRVQSYRWE